jgi:hypothetical protein
MKRDDGQCNVSDGPGESQAAELAPASLELACQDAGHASTAGRHWKTSTPTLSALDELVDQNDDESSQLALVGPHLLQAGIRGLHYRSIAIRCMRPNNSSGIDLPIPRQRAAEYVPEQVKVSIGASRETESCCRVQ